MSERWTRRPEGSTWGDWGEDDQLGRLNLLTPDKVLEGVREVQAGRSFCLSLPLDVPGGVALLERRLPPALSPTLENGAAVFHQRLGGIDPRWIDVVNDDQVTLVPQYSTQWDSLAHIGAEFDADGDGEDEIVYYNGFRAGEHIVGPAKDASRDGREHQSYAHKLGMENMAYKGVQGRGVLIDLAHHLGTESRPVDFDMLRSIMDADNVVVEPGDMVVLHTGWSTEVLGMGLKPDPARIHQMCPTLDATDQRILDWVTQSGLSALIADNHAVETVRAEDPDPGRHAYLPLHHLCLFKLGVHLGEMWYLTELATWLRENRRTRFLLTAPPLRLPGAVGSPTTPIATV